MHIFEYCHVERRKKNRTAKTTLPHEKWRFFTELNDLDVRMIEVGG